MSEQEFRLKKLETLNENGEVEKNPVKQKIQHTIDIEWTPADLLKNKADLETNIEARKKEIEGITKVIGMLEKQLKDVEALLNTPMVKELVEAEEEFIKEQQKNDNNQGD